MRALTDDLPLHWLVTVAIATARRSEPVAKGEPKLVSWVNAPFEPMDCFLQSEKRNESLALCGQITLTACSAGLNEKQLCLVYPACDWGWAFPPSHVWDTQAGVHQRSAAVFVLSLNVCTGFQECGDYIWVTKIATIQLCWGFFAWLR